MDANEKIAQLEYELEELKQSHEKLLETCKAEFGTIGQVIREMQGNNQERDNTIGQMAEILQKIIRGAGRG